jgi:hypothetical protein
MLIITILLFLLTGMAYEIIRKQQQHIKEKKNGEEEEYIINRHKNIINYNNYYDDKVYYGLLYYTRMNYAYGTYSTIIYISDNLQQLYDNNKEIIVREMKSDPYYRNISVKKYVIFSVTKINPYVINFDIIKSSPRDICNYIILCNYVPLLKVLCEESEHIYTNNQITKSFLMDKYNYIKQVVTIYINQQKCQIMSLLYNNIPILIDKLIDTGFISQITNLYKQNKKLFNNIKSLYNVSYKKKSCFTKKENFKHILHKILKEFKKSDC